MLDVLFKKINQVVQRDFNCKLPSWTRGGVAKQGTWMVCLYYVLYWSPSRDPANLQIKYRIKSIMLPFLCPVSKWHFTHKEYNKQYPETHLDEIQEWIEYLSTKYAVCRFDNHSIFIDVFKIWASPGERYSTVAWLDHWHHLLLVRTSVTVNEVYSLQCLLEFVSFTTFAPYSSKGTEWKKEIEISSNNQPVWQSWSAMVYRRISQKMTGFFGQIPV